MDCFYLIVKITNEVVSNRFSESSEQKHKTKLPILHLLFIK